MTPEPALKLFDRCVGSWATEATHPALPGVVVHGSALIEWLEGERFLIIRAHVDHPDFPDSISIIGSMQRDRAHPQQTTASSNEPKLTMHYFDSRGVFRELDVAIDAESWRMERIEKGFSQKFTGTFAADGDTITGLWQLCQDDVQWSDDLQIAYRRRA
jgi:hypothetical protein